MLIFVYNWIFYSSSSSRKQVLYDYWWLENFNIYVNLHPGFKKVEEYLNKLDSLNPGCHEICGKNIYVNIDVYKTKKQNESIAEAHRKYIDVQIILQGYEKIGYSDIKTGKTLVEYDSEKDVEFLSADCDYINAKRVSFLSFTLKTYTIPA